MLKSAPSTPLPSLTSVRSRGSQVSSAVPSIPVAKNSFRRRISRSICFSENIESPLRESISVITRSINSLDSSKSSPLNASVKSSTSPSPRRSKTTRMEKCRQWDGLYRSRGSLPGTPPRQNHSSNLSTTSENGRVSRSMRDQQRRK